MSFFTEILKAFAEAATQESNLATEKEKTYGGVPLSDLSGLASTICEGRVAIRGEYLDFDFKSRRGKYGNTIRFCIQNNKLHKMTFRSYPGQVYYPEDAFMERANELFYFEG